MKHVVFTDTEGYTRRALVRDSDSPDHAEYGIPAGPPDLHLIDWEAAIKDASNALASAGLYTWDDVQRSSGPGLEVALTAFKRHLVHLYRQEHKQGLVNKHS